MARVKPFVEPISQAEPTALDIKQSRDLDQVRARRVPASTCSGVSGGCRRHPQWRCHLPSSVCISSCFYSNGCEPPCCCTHNKHGESDPCSAILLEPLHALLPIIVGAAVCPHAPKSSPIIYTQLALLKLNRVISPR